MFRGVLSRDEGEQHAQRDPDHLIEMPVRRVVST